MELKYPKYEAILAAAGVVVEDGRLLLLEDRWGRWGLPSGFLEQGESPEEALAREVREELGVECEIIGPLRPELQWDGPEGCVFLLLHYAVRLHDHDFAPSEEVVRHRWVAPNEIDQLNVWPNIRRVAQDYVPRPSR